MSVATQEYLALTTGEIVDIQSRLSPFQQRQAAEDRAAEQALDQIDAALHLARINNGPWRLVTVLHWFLRTAERAIELKLGRVGMIDDVALAAERSESMESDLDAAKVFAAHLLGYCYKRTKPSYWMRDMDPVNWDLDDPAWLKDAVVIPRFELLPQEYEVPTPPFPPSVSTEKLPLPIAPIISCDEMDDRLWRNAMAELRSLSYTAANHAQMIAAPTKRMIQATIVLNAWQKQPPGFRVDFLEAVKGAIEILDGPKEVVEPCL